MRRPIDMSEGHTRIERAPRGGHPWVACHTAPGFELTPAARAWLRRVLEAQPRVISVVVGITVVRVQAHDMPSARKIEAWLRAAVAHHAVPYGARRPVPPVTVEPATAPGKLDRDGYTLAEVEAEIVAYIDTHAGCDRADIARYLGVPDVLIDYAITQAKEKGLIVGLLPASDRSR